MLFTTFSRSDCNFFFIDLIEEEGKPILVALSCYCMFSSIQRWCLTNFLSNICLCHLIRMYVFIKTIKIAFVGKMLWKANFMFIISRMLTFLNGNNFPFEFSICTFHRIFLFSLFEWCTRRDINLITNYTL